MDNPYLGVPLVYRGYDPYNPGAPYSYGVGSYKNPYSGIYGPNAQPQPATLGQQPQQQAPQTPALQCIQVPSADYAKSVVLNPNQTLYMVSQNAPELYAKAADSMGVATMKYFKLVEFDPTMEAAQQAVNNQIGNVVSREEFNAFANNVAAQFNAIQQGLPAQGNMQVQPMQQAAPMAPVAPSVQQERTVSKKETVAPKKKETSET